MDEIPWKRIGLTSGLAMQSFPESALPMTVAGRVECAVGWLEGVPIIDECGCPTGERTGPLITEEQAKRMLERL